MKEVIETVAAHAITPRGPIFARHFHIDPDVFDFEIGVPIGTTVAATGRVTAGELPSARVARTTYIGPYEGLGAAWEEFDRWIADNGKISNPKPEPIPKPDQQAQPHHKTGAYDDPR